MDQMLCRIETAVWILMVAFEVTCLGSWLLNGTWRYWPVFSAFQLVDSSASLVLIWSDTHSSFYRTAYDYWGVLSIVLFIGITGELYGRLCRPYCEVEEFRWQLAAVAASGAGLLCAAVFYSRGAFGVRFSAWLTGSFSFWIAAVSRVLWMMRGNVDPYGRNIHRHVQILTVYLVANAVDCILSPLVPAPWAHAGNAVLYGVQAGCFVAWLQFRPEADEAPAFQDLTFSETIEWGRRGMTRAAIRRLLP